MPSLTVYLVDMGWYSVNYTFADPSYWGSGAGCSFATDMCSSSNWGRYFCSNQCGGGCSRGVCNGDRTAVGPLPSFSSRPHYDPHSFYVGECDLGSYTSALPPYYRHFTTATLGGSSKWYDYCPVIQVCLQLFLSSLPLVQFVFLSGLFRSLLQ